MKALLRKKLRWPGIDKDAEKCCRVYRSCQVVCSYELPKPVWNTTLPVSPWQDQALDYLGPLQRGDYVLVINDYYSQ